MRSIITPVMMLMALAACSRGYDATEPENEGEAVEASEESPANGAPSPTERPVRIGEGGPRFDACQAIGKVQGRSSLDVLEAPFDSAKQKDSLPTGRNIWVCTRSIDQQWLGIVYADNSAKPAPTDESGSEEDAAPPPAASPAASAWAAGDCGVSSPVRAKKDYDGPCKSGWVESTFIKLIAS